MPVIMIVWDTMTGRDSYESRPCFSFYKFRTSDNGTLCRASIWESGIIFSLSEQTEKVEFILYLKLSVYVLYVVVHCILLTSCGSCYEVMSKENPH